MEINTKLSGLKAVTRIFQYLGLSHGNWKLQPRDYEVVAEMYYQNHLLRSDQGIKDPKIRYTLIMEKDNLNKLGEKLGMGYNAIANTKTKMKRAGLLTNDGFHPAYGRIKFDKEDLKLILKFNAGRPETKSGESTK